MTTFLKNIATIKAGHPFRGAIPDDETGNGYVIQVKDIDADGNICWDDLTLTQVQGRKEPDWLKSGDVIFMARGTRCAAAAIKQTDKQTVCSPHFFIIELTTDELLPEFLVWQLNQVVSQRYFKKSAQGSAQLSIKRSVLEATPIAIPNVNIQQQIVSMAACAQKEKQVLTQLIHNREQQLAAIAQDLFTQRIQ
ncbi:hypothetical protein C9J44_04970 [Photobacterium sp. GB-27]|uniref:restriction endonuclease subunit S n=1 Tax=Photobacterium TaxID=657 RepID=UPI000D153B81|nr:MULTISPECIES: restriction endonuclease subunit S [Photobacterium]MBP2698726.1 restriction endonuclease subunit S [Vibrio parahaemolyticus]MZG58112.1 restriction endonuclease subunit S [Photobacterium lucens]MZG79460.1 restriction endonuclease subunit S [Photobacterium lucens]PSV38380.1 hypothetical protein C9J44_04970 [Photobacterium sp. GB-27]